MRPPGRTAGGRLVEKLVETHRDSGRGALEFCRGWSLPSQSYNRCRAETTKKVDEHDYKAGGDCDGTAGG